MLIYQKHITREDIKANPNVLYVFGDNLERVGMGGQAYEMRGEPNSVGIPTKKRPSQHSDSFFSDDDYELFIKESYNDIQRLINHYVNNSGTIVWPLDDIGTGLADLPNKAPKIYAFIQEYKRRHTIIYNSRILQFIPIKREYVNLDCIKEIPMFDKFKEAVDIIT